MSQRKGHGGRKSFLDPPVVLGLAFSYHLLPNLLEKQQLEVHPSALFSPSNPMAQLSTALGSIGHGSMSTWP